MTISGCEREGREDPKLEMSASTEGSNPPGVGIVGKAPTRHETPGDPMLNNRSPHKKGGGGGTGERPKRRGEATMQLAQQHGP